MNATEVQPVERAKQRLDAQELDVRPGAAKILLNERSASPESPLTACARAVRFKEGSARDGGRQKGRVTVTEFQARFCLESEKIDSSFRAIHIEPAEVTNINSIVGWIECGDTFRALL